MEESVYGEWNNLVFKKPLPSDIDAIMEHLKNYFLLDEPVSKLVGYDEERRKDLDNFVRFGISNGLSIVVVDKTNDKVAAVQINDVEDLDAEQIDPIPNPSLKTHIARKFWEKLKGSVNIFENYKVRTIAELRITSVSRDFRRKGITKELYTRSLALLKQKQFPIVKGIFSNAYTRKVAEQTGFQEICREYFSNNTDENGICIFPNKPDPEDFASLMILRL